LSQTLATEVNRTKGRNAVTNGRMHPRGIDGRLRSARRFRDLFAAFAESLGGEAGLTEADRSLARMAATLQVKSEALQADAAQGLEIDSEQLVRVANSLSRVLARLGKRAAPRDAPQTLADYLAQNHAEAAE
jgi:uncharacterized protein YbjQ (UPF0145 family)